MSLKHPKMNMNTLIIIRINNAMLILKYQFGYPNISLLSSSSSINNNINIENIINKNNMMMMNASVASYPPDLHAGSSSHLSSRTAILMCLGAETTKIERSRGT
jgi:hypothetical protein